MASGTVTISERDGRRCFRVEHRFAGRHAPEVRGQIHAGPCDLVEFHAVLIRTDAFDRLGPLDEGLKSAFEENDLCLDVRRLGGGICLEPDSVISYMQPPPVAWCDIPYFLLRWSDGLVRRERGALLRQVGSRSHRPGVRLIATVRTATAPPAVPPPAPCVPPHPRRRRRPVEAAAAVAARARHPAFDGALAPQPVDLADSPRDRARSRRPLEVHRPHDTDRIGRRRMHDQAATGVAAGAGAGEAQIARCSHRPGIRDVERRDAALAAERNQRACGQPASAAFITAPISSPIVTSASASIGVHWSTSAPPSAMLTDNQSSHSPDGPRSPPPPAAPSGFLVAGPSRRWAGQSRARHSGRALSRRPHYSRIGLHRIPCDAQPGQ